MLIQFSNQLIFPILFVKVTVISPVGNELKNPPTNYTNIVIGHEIASEFKSKFIMSENCDEIFLIKNIFKSTLIICLTRNPFRQF